MLAILDWWWHCWGFHKYSHTGRTDTVIPGRSLYARNRKPLLVYWEPDCELEERQYICISWALKLCSVLDSAWYTWDLMVIQYVAHKLLIADGANFKMCATLPLYYSQSWLQVEHACWAESFKPSTSEPAAWGFKSSRGPCSAHSRCSNLCGIPL